MSPRFFRAGSRGRPAHLRGGGGHESAATDDRGVFERLQRGIEAADAARHGVEINLGHDVSLIQSTELSEQNFSQTTRDHELKGA